ncbi:hypothetical protein MUY21_15700 [Aliiroseovarius sp. S2029]|uniref:hypothetical protein n=1 Tax=Aliiroseovarius sp. S2029 TaxID=2936988 RepID=UPI0020BE7004|nr:hypothetical protein [Aliiroseovarius sp. S2029]MCK8485486.1 hypothetical protein [Aliiroseovarius sp. S2029]
MDDRVSKTSRASDILFRLASDDADLPHLVDLAKSAHDESRFSYIPFCADKVCKIARKAFDDTSRHAVMLAIKHDAPVGFAYCSIGEYHIGQDVLITTIHNMNVSRSLRRSLSGGRVALGLFKGVETWSAARGSREVLFHVTSGVDLARSHKLAKHIGYKFIGGSYAKGIG